MKKCETCHNEIFALEQQCNELYKKKELEKDKLHSQKTERVKLDLAIRNVIKEVILLSLILTYTYSNIVLK